MIKLEELIINDNAELAKWTNLCEQLPIFPVNGDVNSKKYKTPLTPNGFYDATTAEDKITSWWNENNTAMIGLATGEASGICVIDIDVKKGIDGFKSIEKLEETLSKLPETFETRTPSNGAHKYYRIPDGISIPCTQNQKLALDLRSDGGYVIYADSQNTAGQAYEVTKQLPMVDLPIKWIEFFQSSKAKNEATLTDGIISEGGRNVGLTSLVGTFLNKGVTGDKLHELAHMMNKKLCELPLPDWEVDSIVESIGKRDRGYAHNSIGNGHRFADRHADNVKCVNKGNTKTWFIWDETKWTEDTLALTSELAKNIAIDLEVEAENLPQDTSEKLFKSLYGLAKKTQENPHKILSMACSDPRIAVTKEAFDRHDHLAPCLDGVLDLNTGEFSSHQPELLYTKQFKANFNPDAVSEKWNDFVRFLTNNDKDIEAFFARFYGGLGLIGGNPEQKMMLLLGKGSNGKSTFNEIIRYLSSDYSDTLRKEVLCSKSQKDYRHDLADLKNARFITVTEPMQDFEMNGAFIKEITGGDTIKGRQNYSDSETFKCKGLISLASNWEPSLYNGDEGLERRFIVYRHNAVISASQKDPNLVQKINEESDAVLAWLYKGRMDYLKNVKLKEQGYLESALNPPETISNMTEDFINRQDPFKAFIKSDCIEGNGYKVQAEPFFNAFCAYCLMSGEKHPSQKRFYEIASNKYSKTMVNGCVHYLGITLKK